VKTIARKPMRWLLVVGLLSATPIVSAPAVEREKYLLLDSRIVDTVTDAQLTVGTVTKHPANPFFGQDKPWETSLDNLYPNVVYDDQAELYKAWYHIYYPAAPRGGGLAYAESTDGLDWYKPNLGLVDYEGSTDNNILFEEVGHGIGVSLDRHETDPAKRFKMFYGTESHVGPIATRFSPDGINWGVENLSSQKPRGDTHNNAFWAPTLNKYVGISRGWVDPWKERLVQRMESTDFINWTAPVTVLRGGETRQTYSMPVFYYGGVYLGLPSILMYDNGQRVQAELAWSPDTVNWYRIQEGTPLIPNSETVGDYDWGIVYSAVTPIFEDDEIRLYYGGSPMAHIGNYSAELSLATLRPDGFAGYQPTEEETVGVVTTVPATYSGTQLYISADAEGGAVRISVLDDEGTPVGQSEPVTTDLTDGVIYWQGDFVLADYLGGNIQLRFELENATIYAFTFTPGGLNGDLNGDGYIGGIDLDIIIGHWGQSVTPGDPLLGDPSGDGFVGSDDLDLVQADWGRGVPTASSSSVPAGVPEPSSLAMLTLGGLVLWVRRRYRV